MKRYLVYTTLVCFALVSCKTETVFYPKANFECANSLSIGDTLKVINKCTNATEYIWDFGDGTTSTLNAPIHIYEKNGDVNIKLIAFKGELKDSVIKTISVQNIKPVSNFTVNSTDSIPLIFEKITFNNTSKYATSYLWDFGDGNTSTENNPLHSYSQTGNYTIKLTTYNEKGNNTVEKNITITDIKTLNPNDTGIDVDNDGIVDFNLETFLYHGTSQWGITISLKNHRNYNIFTEIVRSRSYNYCCYDSNYDIHKTDTVYSNVEVIKAFNLGDTIFSFNESTNKELLYLSYRVGQDRIFETSYDTFWKMDEVHYLGFKKSVNGILRIGWLKLKVKGLAMYETIEIKIPSECESLKINH